MQSRLRVWLLATNVVIFIGGGMHCSNVSAQHPTIDDIVGAWKVRQNKVASGRFELKCDDTIHKGYFTLRNEIAGIDALGSASSQDQKAPTGPNPSENHEVTGTNIVRFSDSKLFYSSDIPAWDPHARVIYNHYYASSFDGHFFKTFDNPASGEQQWAQASVRRADKSQQARLFSINPIILAFRGAHPQFFDDLVKYEMTHRTSMILGRPCFELVFNPSARNRTVMYVDSERDYVLVRKLNFDDDRPASQLDVSYSADQRVRWVPKTWEFVVQLGDDNAVFESGRRSVTHYDIRPVGGEDNAFDIAFPPGTRVIDMSVDREVQYVIKADNKKGIVLPTDSNPAYGDLLKPEHQRSTWWARSLWFVVLAVAVGGLVWKSLRRRKRPTTAA